MEQGSRHILDDRDVMSRGFEEGKVCVCVCMFVSMCKCSGESVPLRVCGCVGMK